MKYQTIIGRLYDRCYASSQTTVADELGVSKQYLCDVLAGRRELGPKMLSGLGLYRIVSYRRLTNGSNRPTNGNPAVRG